MKLGKWKESRFRQHSPNDQPFAFPNSLSIYTKQLFIEFIPLNYTYNTARLATLVTSTCFLSVTSSVTQKLKTFLCKI